MAEAAAPLAAASTSCGADASSSNASKPSHTPTTTTTTSEEEETEKPFVSTTTTKASSAENDTEASSATKAAAPPGQTPPPSQTKASKKKQQQQQQKSSKTVLFPLNINVGIMGHVDSGKTSLVKALSQTLSTAALDKHPQSQQRGITIDLGFSAFKVPMPPHLRDACEKQGYATEELQFTLVDCPGHASLIRTIIGGAQIIDMMVLVVDCVKGIQTQTAECLVIGEITTDHLIIVLNKIDAIPEKDREERLAKTEKKIRAQLKTSKFANAPVARAAAAVGGEKVAAAVAKDDSRRDLKRASAASSSSSSTGGEHWGLNDVVKLVTDTAVMPARDVEGPFFFAIDHCFSIRGQGTVVTGTCLRGRASTNAVVELPQLGVEKKIKSMQMFRKPVKEIACGDRAGVCLAQLDASLVERGIVAKTGTVPLVSLAVARVNKIRFFRRPCETGTKFHITVGHATTLAEATFFGFREGAPETFDDEKEYAFQDELEPSATTTFDDDHGHQAPPNSERGRPNTTSHPRGASSSQNNWTEADMVPQYALLKFDARVRCQADALVVGSRLDGDDASTQCRIAFHGRLVAHLDAKELQSKVRIFKLKQKTGIAAKLDSPVISSSDQKQHSSNHKNQRGHSRRLHRDVLGKDLFAKETNMQRFAGLTVQAETGEVGHLVGGFGKSGKFKVHFPDGTSLRPNGKLVVRYKRYLFAPHTKDMHQDDDCVVDVVARGHQRPQNGSPQGGGSPEQTLSSEQQQPSVALSAKTTGASDDNGSLSPPPTTNGAPKTRAASGAENRNGRARDDNREDEEDQAVRRGADNNETTKTPGHPGAARRPEEASASRPEPAAEPRERAPPKKTTQKGVPCSSDVTTAAPEQQQKRLEHRTGKVERLKGDPLPNGRHAVVVAEGFFKQEDDQRPHLGAVVRGANDERGRLAGAFGKAGKSKVDFSDVGGTTLKVGDALYLHCACDPAPDADPDADADPDPARPPPPPNTR